MKREIKVFLAKEWIIFFVFCIVAIGFIAFNELSVKQICYYKNVDSNILSDKELKTKKLIDQALYNSNHLASDITQTLVERKEQIPNIVNECLQTDNEYFLNTKKLVDKSSDITILIIVVYIFTQAIRFLAFLTMSSIRTIRDNKGESGEE